MKITSIGCRKIKASSYLWGNTSEWWRAMFQNTESKERTTEEVSGSSRWNWTWWMELSEQKNRSPVEHEEPAVSLHQSHSAALQSGSVDMHTVAMVTCVAVKVPGCLGPLRSVHSKPQVLFCWHLFPAFQNFTGHFSYFGEGESCKRPSHCAD